MHHPDTTDYMASLRHFAVYLAQAFRETSPGRGYFGDPSHLEAGVRTNANVAFCAALLASDPAYSAQAPDHDT